MLCLAAQNGVVFADHAPEWRVAREALAGHSVTSVIGREGVVLAGTVDGVYRSDDEGLTWREVNEGLSQRHIRWLAYHPEISDFEVAGTEPAGIFISRDGANTWRGADEVPALRDQKGWFLPYSPQAGCVRGFAFHQSRLYAAVEVGGVLRSDDYGESWKLAEGSTGSPDMGGPFAPLIHPDVHSILVHPSSPDRVVAPTGGGLFHSTDGGRSWGWLYHCYCRAAWVDPDDPAHIVFGPADNVDRNGRIEESFDTGKTWRLASAGLEVPWRRHMVERFVQGEGGLFGVLSNGEVVYSPLPVGRWSAVLPEVKGVKALWVIQNQ